MSEIKNGCGTNPTFYRDRLQGILDIERAKGLVDYRMFPSPSPLSSREDMAQNAVVLYELCQEADSTEFEQANWA